MIETKNFITEVERITREATEPRVIEVGEHRFTKDDLKAVLPPKVQGPAPLTLGTLNSLVEYLEANRDALELSKLLVHVESPTKVSVRGMIQPDNYNERFRYAVAETTPAAFRFGTFHPIVDVVVALQAQFVDTEHRKALLKFLGNVKDETRVETGDDGTSQEVTVRSSIRSVAENAVAPNPVTLAPFRTFPEVEQPESLFVLRLEKGPRVGLWEADGGRWSLEAVESIGGWLTERLESMGVAVAF